MIKDVPLGILIKEIIGLANIKPIIPIIMIPMPSIIF